jgi:hypothetical protein
MSHSRRHYRLDLESFVDTVSEIQLCYTLQPVAQYLVLNIISRKLFVSVNFINISQINDLTSQGVATMMAGKET